MGLPYLCFIFLAMLLAPPSFLGAIAHVAHDVGGLRVPWRVHGAALNSSVP